MGGWELRGDGCALGSRIWKPIFDMRSESSSGGIT